ncbi:MAG TPA: carboxypeptidase regulatory-like domain-containing protein [Solirubrobacteraceae bacterium]|nr:carboxypeptidase regulatory-like domain-containing protein [Solirubrobacteraceae bacterium]
MARASALALAALVGALVIAGAAQAAPTPGAPALGGALEQFAGPALTGGTGEVGGTVTSAKTSEPLVGIEVCAIENNAEAFTRCSLSGAGGEYAVSGLPAAEYIVEFYSVPGAYVTQYYDGKSSIASSTKVPVAEGALTSGVDAAMVPAGEIAGSVTQKSSGEPLENVKVCVLGSGSEPVLQCTSTGSTGEYAVKRLPAGDYAVEFFPLSGEYVTEFYDERYSLAGATRVSVGEGQLVEGIDAGMAQAGRLTGKVTAETSEGPPLENVKVCAFSSSGESIACANSKPNGEYELTRLPEGLYTVEFFSYEGIYVTEYYSEKFSFAEANKVLVSGGAVTSGIDAALISTGVISGRVTDAEDGDPITGVLVCAKAVGAEASAQCAVTGSAGEYSIVRLPRGEYVVRFSSPSAEFATQYYDDAFSEAEAEALPVENGVIEKDIDASMEPTAHRAAPENTAPPTISGTVAVGEVLTCEKGTWSGSPTPSFKYRWLHDGSAISSATGETYTVATADQGHALTCEVTADNNVYSVAAKSFKVSAVSAAVSVPSPPLPEEHEEPASAGGGSTTGQTSTGSSSTSSSGNSSSSTGSSEVASFKNAKISLGRVKATSDAVLVSLRCTAPSGSCPAATVELTVVEKLTAGKVTALSAKSGKRTVVLGKLTVTITAGQSRTVKVALNAAGRKLLSAHGRLPVEVSVSAGSSTVGARHVTLSAKKKHKT